MQLGARRSLPTSHPIVTSGLAGWWNPSCSWVNIMFWELFIIWVKFLPQTMTSRLWSPKAKLSSKAASWALVLELLIELNPCQHVLLYQHVSTKFWKLSFKNRPQATQSDSQSTALTPFRRARACTWQSWAHIHAKTARYNCMHRCRFSSAGFRCVKQGVRKNVS